MLAITMRVSLIYSRLFALVCLIQNCTVKTEYSFPFSAFSFINSLYPFANRVYTEHVSLHYYFFVSICCSAVPSSRDFLFDLLHHRFFHSTNDKNGWKTVQT